MITKTEEGVPSTDEFVADMRAAGAQLQVGAERLTLLVRWGRGDQTRPEAWIEAAFPVARWLGVGFQKCVQLGRSCRWVLLWGPERQLPTCKKKGQGGSSSLGQRLCL